MVPEEYIWAIIFLGIAKTNELMIKKYDYKTFKIKEVLTTTNILIVITI